jgi:hypothetical protein
MGIAFDYWSVAEPLVLGQVGNHHHIALTDGGIANRQIARHFAHTERQVHQRLDPLARVVDEADVGGRASANFRSEIGEIVKGGIGRRVQDIRGPKGLEPCAFVGAEDIEESCCWSLRRRRFRSLHIE